MKGIVEHYGEEFPESARCSDSLVLKRMFWLIRSAEAESWEEAFEKLKENLKRLNASVQVK